MANKYVRSAAAGSADGSTWANAYTTLVAAFAGMSAGDTAWVADDHAETQGSTMTLTSPGTAGNPCRVLGVNTHVTEPPTGMVTTPTATVTTTSSFSISFGGGFCYIEGVKFSAASANSSNGFNFGVTGSALGWYLKNCPLKVGTGGSTGRIITAVNRDAVIVMDNCTIELTHASQSIQLGGLRWVWKNTASALLGTIPTTLIIAQVNNYSPDIYVYGVDLSAMGSGKNLVSGSAVSIMRVLFRNCKLGASVAAITGTIVGPGGMEVLLDNCDSGNTNYRMEHYKYQGSIKQETTKVRTSGGASDGTTAISHNFTTLATGPSLFFPLVGPWMTIWNDTSGSSKTVTVELCTENVGLYNDECWLEIEGLATSGYPLSALPNNRMADAFATHALLTTSAAAWSGFTTAAPQKLAVAFTPQVKGPIRARVCVAKASATVYVDPLLTVS